MFRSLLIANRGEIACRIIRTARKMGVRTVAIHSEADAGALHVRMADSGVLIASSNETQSYLNGSEIISAALQAGAEAIHPGYGFLSENADFAQAVIDAGLIWIGPDPASIRAMGLKDAAKALMADAGVPVTPGYLGNDQSAERLMAEAQEIGWPVLIKAVAGGGGKGMRRVDSAEAFPAALDSCRREAQASFGNDVVLIEKLIASPRHIEVQIFGDRHGNTVHLFERDCSLQRRHQKVIEEAPAPGMDEQTRAAICAAAVRAAKAVDYVGAGTVEFIADASDGLHADRIWFMEMNTRLQVEHPVTEEITGIDLVEWQFRVAAGETLPLQQDQIRMRGHAMEARLYAEDPARGFLPSTGRFTHFELKPRDLDTSLRIETGVDRQSEVTPFYDPMIAKLVMWGETREEAAADLRGACEDVAIAPVKTNAGFLARCLGHPDFLAGAVDTGFIERNLEALITPTGNRADMATYAAWAVFGDVLSRMRNRETVAPAFRLNAPPHATARVEDDDGGVYAVDLLPYLDPSWRVFYDYTFDSGTRATTIFNDGDATAFHAYRPQGGDGAGGGSGAIISPMPGRIIAVYVKPGEAVAKGARLLTLEAMKMEHTLTAPFDGTVADLPAREGAQVQVDALLARVERTDADGV